jgi:hypothetical protein
VRACTMRSAHTHARAQSVHCYGVCGDADGDGDPGVTSPALAAAHGVDVPYFGGSESALIAFDFTGDAIADVVIGCVGVGGVCVV